MATSGTEITTVKPWPGHKLFDPANYTGEEYVILFLASFILFVMIKHLIFHTGYFWWFGNARFVVPQKFWNIVTGKTLGDRLYNYVQNNFGDKNDISPAVIAKTIAHYCITKECAFNTGEEKGEVLEEILKQNQPKSVMIYRPHCGYVLMKIISIVGPESHIYLIEPDAEFEVLNRKLAELAGLKDRVTVINSDVTSGLKEIRENYATKLDFVFLNRTGFEQASHRAIVEELEQNKMLTARTETSYGSVVISDKVVHIGDSEFLKYVRKSSNFETKYYQMALENSPEEIVDAMESAVYISQ